MRPARFKAALILLVLCASSAWTQSATSSSSSSATSVSALPEPYTKDEFPSWAVGLRRFEIITLGAFPILLFYTRLGFDLKRYVDSGFDSNGFDKSYVPWPFKNENSYEASDEEQILSVKTAAGLSLAFGVLDAFFLWMASRE